MATQESSMAAQPSATILASRYQKFRTPRQVFFNGELDNFGTVVDEDGSTLYENDESVLLSKIVEFNDVATLKRYLATNTRRYLGPGGYPTEDPFYNALTYGSTDALRVLLEYWDAANPPTHIDVPKPNERDYSMLSVASGHGRIDTVRFLLDGPWKATYGNIHGKDSWGSTALLAAAGSLKAPYCRNRRGEEVIQLLLDRGACVQDVCTAYEPQEAQEPFETVLGLAISGASPALVKRLIDQGADIHAKMACNSLEGYKDATGITALHIGSKYSNVGGIQVLLNYIQDTGGINLVQQADSDGQFPLHYAVCAPYNHYYITEEGEQILPHIVATIKLLLEADPSIINAQNKEGNTALHLAVKIYGPHGNRDLAIPRILCKYGADASICGRNGETPLHGVGFRLSGCEPFDASLIDLLLEHGASVGDKDHDGNTPLHFAARNWLYIEAARHLLSKGADLSATDRQGNTPLHQAANGSRGAFKRSRHGPFLFLAEPWVESQDAMMKVLLHGVSAETADALMDQPNTENKTPRQICREKRIEWQEKEKEDIMKDVARRQDMERRRVKGAERGRGRGRGGCGG